MGGGKQLERWQFILGESSNWHLKVALLKIVFVGYPLLDRHLLMSGLDKGSEEVVSDVWWGRVNMPEKTGRLRPPLLLHHLRCSHHHWLKAINLPSSSDIVTGRLREFSGEAKLSLDMRVIIFRGFEHEV